MAGQNKLRQFHLLEGAVSVILIKGESQLSLGVMDSFITIPQLCSYSAANPASGISPAKTELRGGKISALRNFIKLGAGVLGPYITSELPLVPGSSRNQLLNKLECLIVHGRLYPRA